MRYLWLALGVVLAEVVGVFLTLGAADAIKVALDGGEEPSGFECALVWGIGCTWPVAVFLYAAQRFGWL